MRGLLIAVLALIAAAAAPAAEAPLAPLYGWQYRDQQRPPLFTRLDPPTLRPVGKRVELGGDSGGASFSPDRSRVAIGGEPRLRILDLASMRWVSTMRLVQRGYIRFKAWPSPRRVLVIAGEGETGDERLLVADPYARRIVRQAPLPGTMLGLAVVPDRLVLLLGRQNRIEPLRLAVVDDEGRIRIAALAVSGGDVHRRRTRSPGLTTDPTGSRAYIVEPDGSVAVVDLTTLRVEYHFALQRTLSKGAPGDFREAGWIGDGLLAVTGGRSRRTSDAHHPFEWDASGLEVIDTRTWTRRMIDPLASGAAYTAGTLLTLGRHASCGDDTSAISGYALDGTLRFRFCERPLGFLQTFGGRYAYVPTLDNRRTIIDIVAGKVVGRAPLKPLISPLAPAGFGGYGI